MIRLQDPDFTLHVGDVRDVLAELPAESVHCVVTSPPYWGLRDYSTEGQLGLEATPDEFVASMVEVFRGVRRVLRADGSLWLNLGSSYASGDTPTTRLRPGAPAYGTDGTTPSGSSGLGSAYPGLCDGCLDDFRSHLHRTPDTPQPPGQDALRLEQTDRGNATTGSVSTSPVASPPDVQASTTLESWLRLRGSCLRCDSRAASLSDVRSSASDAQASSHMPWLNYTSRLKPKDMVPTPWMVAMALQQDGWYLRADIVWAKPNPMPESVTDRPTKAHEYLFLLTKQPRYYFDNDAIRQPHAASSLERGYGYRAGAKGPSKPRGGTSQDAGAASRDGGLSDWKASVELVPTAGGANVRSVWEIATQPYPDAHFATFPEELPRRCILAGCPEGGTVLDPFIGSGTTAHVARKLGRRSIGIELNPAYADLCARRMQQLSLLAEAGL